AHAHLPQIRGRVGSQPVELLRPGLLLAERPEAQREVDARADPPGLVRERSLEIASGILPGAELARPLATIDVGGRGLELAKLLHASERPVLGLLGLPEQIVGGRTPDVRPARERSLIGSRAAIERLLVATQ